MAAPTVIGTGWTTVFDYPFGPAGTRRRRMRMGPYKTIDAEVASLRSSLDVEELDVSVTPGSAIATVTVTYAGGDAQNLPAGERRWPQIAIRPGMAQIDLKAHPQIETLGTDRKKIEDLINQGNIEEIKSAYSGNALALRYARILVAGVTSYEAPTVDLYITRYYHTAPSLSSDYAAINKVYSWGNLKTDGKSVSASISEPKWVDHNGTAKSYEWRLLSVSPQYQRGTDDVVQWIFQGLQRWAKWLYSGGSWEPPAL